MSALEKAVAAVKEFRSRRNTMFDDAWQPKPGYTTAMAERFYSDFGQTAARLLPELIDLIKADDVDPEHGMRCHRCLATTFRLSVRDWANCLGCGTGGATSEFTHCDSFCEDCEDCAVSDEAELHRLHDDLEAKQKRYAETLIRVEGATQTKLTPFVGRWMEVQAPHGTTYAFGKLLSASRTTVCVDHVPFAIKDYRFICHPAANSSNRGPSGASVIPVLLPSR
ncbi:hypothetical protein ACLF6K_06210 [Streptomyces xanthophaeus]|uniref:hypothetical protein n=1 Tax=Streptomyces xanthophaeus TaxID=67385 RepID=UPI00398FA322